MEFISYGFDKLHASTRYQNQYRNICSVIVWLGHLSDQHQQCCQVDMSGKETERCMGISAVTVLSPLSNTIINFDKLVLSLTLTKVSLVKFSKTSW